MSLIERVLKEYKILKRKEIEEINIKIKELEANKKPILADIVKATIELENICKHENTNRVPGTYMSGGYDHVSEQPYTIQCVDCGKTLETYTIRGTYA